MKKNHGIINEIIYNQKQEKDKGINLSTFNHNKEKKSENKK